jgi:hypothetical protein
MQVPVATLAEQLSPAPSLTVTVPVGVPAPGGVATTVKVTVTGCPTTTEVGLTEVIVVVLFALATV